MASVKGKGSAVNLTKAVVETACAAGPGTTWDTKVPGLGVRVMASGRASFTLRYRLATGTQRFLTIAGWPTLTVDQARQLARAKLAEVAAGIDPADAAQALRSAPTLADVGRYYCDKYGVEAKLRPRTIADARRVLQLRDGDKTPAIMARKLVEITTEDLRALVFDYQSRSGNYEANRLRAVLSKCFNLAIREKRWLTGANPCAGIKKFPEDERWRYYSEAETLALLDASDAYAASNPDYGTRAALAVRLMLHTGGRLQEVLKATWSQFDLSQGVWIRKAATTKTDRLHKLDLDGPVLDLLAAARADDPECLFLFPGKPAKDGSVKPRVDLNKPWQAIVKAAGVTDARRHDLRRTTASYILSDGGHLPTVGKVLGHTQAATTARYAQLMPQVQRSAVGRLGHKLAGLQQEEGRRALSAGG